MTPQRIGGNASTVVQYVQTAALHPVTPTHPCEHRRFSGHGPSGLRQPEPMAQDDVRLIAKNTL